MPRWPFRRHHSYGPLSIDSTVEQDLQPVNRCNCRCSAKLLTVLSVLWLILVLFISAGLTAYLLLKADMVIDKSIREFSIPNHETSRRADALELAIHGYSDPGQHLVMKRSADNVKQSAGKESAANERMNEELSEKQRENLDNVLKFEPGGSEKEEETKGEQIHVMKRSAYSEYGVTQRVLRWKLQLAFIAVGEEGERNILSRDRLETIHGIETAIRSHPDYMKFCWKDFGAALKDPTLERQHGGCSPINSLLTYFFPTVDRHGQVYYNGLGRELSDVDSALDLAMAHDSFYYYVGDGFNKTTRSGVLLHSEVFFGAPIHGYMDVIDRPHEQNEKFSRFITSYVNMLSKVSTDKVQVLYGGNEIYDYEVNHSFWSDMRLALVAVASIGLLMLVLTSFSAWLTLCGLWSIVLSFPLALTTYRIVFQVRALGILNGAAAFVIVGIGVDDVFVFINTFRHHANEPSLWRRLRVTMATAGKATFFTSFTTSAAFAANIASSIPAVHNFGLFMSLIVGCCWLTVLAIMPPALALWARACGPCETACYRRCDVCQGGNVLPDEMAQFFSPGSHGNAPSNQGCHSNEPQDDDDDAQLLRMDAVASTDNGLWVDIDDDPLLLLENQLEQSVQSEEGCSLIGRLQILLYDWLAVPVVKARWFIIGAFFLVLVVCCGLITQLRVADKPPQFFKPDSNLQKFYDLKANLSIDLLQCYQCAALYEVAKKHNAHQSSNAHVAMTTSAPPLSTTHVTSTLTTPFHDVTKAMTSPASTVTTKADYYDVTPTTASSVSSTTEKQPTAPDSVDPAPPTHPNRRVEPPEGGAGGVAGVDRPVKKSSAPVYVVFGIRDLDTSGQDPSHVLSSEGTVVYASEFAAAFNLSAGSVSAPALRQLCSLCHVIAGNTELVEPGSAQCLPTDLPPEIEMLLASFSECRDLPRNKLVFDQQLPVRSVLMFGRGHLKWIAFAFQSKTIQSASYFQGYSDYQKWEKFIQKIKTETLDEDSPLRSIYQISPFWKKVFMEVLGVSSAVYGLVLSLAVCVLAVSVFTGHVLLLLIVMASIIGMLLCVVAVVYACGWRLGAVEAISLSILVGSSVDYCVHLVEGYLQAGVNPPFHLTLKRSALREWRTRNALTRIGLSILSSALTTFIAALPLTQTNIQPFAQFGRIVAICTVVSIVYTLTACAAMLAAFAPSHFTSSWRSTLVSTVATGVLVALVVLALYLVTLAGVHIPGPSGQNLFS